MTRPVLVEHGGPMSDPAHTLAGRRLLVVEDEYLIAIALKKKSGSTSRSSQGSSCSYDRAATRERH